jgi:hypothetical protein
MLMNLSFSQMPNPLQIVLKCWWISLSLSLSQMLNPLQIVQRCWWISLLKMLNLLLGKLFDILDYFIKRLGLGFSIWLSFLFLFSGLASLGNTPKKDLALIERR